MSQTNREDGPPRIRWTRKRVRLLEESGVIVGERFELVEGELYNKKGQTPAHATGINRLNTWLSTLFGITCVRIQAPIHVAPEDDEDSKPEPDVAVTLEEEDAYVARHPGPADLALVAEVADSTVAFDRGTKAALYARAGISQYWLLDLKSRQLIVHREPKDGLYTAILVCQENDLVAPASQQSVPPVRVGDLLPPA